MFFKTCSSPPRVKNLLAFKSQLKYIAVNSNYYSTESLYLWPPHETVKGTLHIPSCDCQRSIFENLNHFSI